MDVEHRAPPSDTRHAPLAHACLRAPRRVQRAADAHRDAAQPSESYAKELLGLGVTVPGSAFDDVFCRILLGSLVCCVQVLLTGCTDATVPTATRPSTFDGSA